MSESSTSRPKPPVSSGIRSWLEEERRSFEDHPTLEEWNEYREGRVKPDRAERLKDHLVLCNECADLLLDLSSFAKAVPPEGARPISDGQVEAAWWQLQAKLGEVTPREQRAEETEAAPVASIQAHGRKSRPVPEDGRRTSNWRAPLSLIAAALLVGVVGLSIWSQSRPGLTPRLNSDPTEEARYLVAQDAPSAAVSGTTRGSRTVRRVTAEPLVVGQAHSLALPKPLGVPHYPAYELTIVREADNSPVYQSRGVELKSGLEGESGEGFTLQLPRGFLPSGRYEIQVSGLGRGDSRHIVSYWFEMTP
jgi:hypothetical protein